MEMIEAQQRMMEERQQQMSQQTPQQQPPQKQYYFYSGNIYNPLKSDEQSQQGSTYPQNP